MSYQALYRKYRPTVFSDVVGQEHITEILQREIAEDKLSHAYLFTGTRGTGKTTCAKILARAVNCLSAKGGNPCGECELCRAANEGEITDIVEIDAASNNTVDSIRELRDQIAFPPAAAKYRVYIIDEVHMLSISAFNALLKTLEEPPSYVIFILATTEVHKLPSTILSRCQRFDFKRIEPSYICERIQKIASAEGFKVTDAASQLIASIADGGMRDAISILDLCASGSSVIDEDTVEKSCAMAGNEYLLKLAAHIKNKDAEKALLLIDELHNSSVDMVRLLSELTYHFRNLMIIKTVKSEKKPIVCSSAQLAALKEQAEGFELTEIMDILEILQDAAPKMAAGNKRAQMEMTLIRLSNPQIFTDIKALERRIADLERGIVNKAVENSEKSMSSSKTQNSADGQDELPIPPDDDDEYLVPLPEEPLDSDFKEEEEPPIQTPAKVEDKLQTQDLNDGDLKLAEWGDILALLRRTCPLIAGVLGGSQAYISGNYLLIDTKNGQFKTLVNGANSLYRDQIRKAAFDVLGKTYKLGPYHKPENAEVDTLAAFARKLESLEK